MKKFVSSFELIFVLTLFLGLLIFTIYINNARSYSQHYAIEAYSLINGHFDLIGDSKEKYLDTVVINNKYYFAGDPVTALLIVPFAAVSSIFDAVPRQSWLNLIIIAGVVFFLNKLLILKDIKIVSQRVWFFITFLFASSIVSIIYVPNTWNLAQMVGVLFSLLYIYIWNTKSRKIIYLPLLILVTFTRKQLLLPLALFSIVSLVSEAVKTYPKSKKPIFGIVGVIVFCIISYSLYTHWYNTHFNIPIKLDSTSYAHILPIHKRSMERFGQFNLYYLPKNIYFYFINMPTPVKQSDLVGSNLKWPFLTVSDYGTSFFLLGPLFIFIFLLKGQEFKESLPYLISATLLMFLYLTFFTSGEQQFGLRYSADAIPFLFIPLVLSLKNNFSPGIKLLISGSAIFNAFLLIAFFASGRTI